MTLTDWLKKTWMKYSPRFLCKELRRQEEIRIAELATIDEYVKKHEMFFTLKGLTISTFEYNPKYRGTKPSRWVGYVEDNNGQMLTSYCLAKTVIEAKQEAIYKYYRQYGPQKN
jgi:hypothetical protein